MQAALEDFFRALRAADVRVSPAEAIDAHRTVEVVGFANRELFRDALCATLAKSGDEVTRFESVFDTFFDRRSDAVAPAPLHAPAPQEPPTAASPGPAQKAPAGQATGAPEAHAKPAAHGEHVARRTRWLVLSATTSVPISVTAMPRGELKSAAVP